MPRAKEANIATDKFLHASVLHAACGRSQRHTKKKDFKDDMAPVNLYCKRCEPTRVTLTTATTMDSTMRKDLLSCCLQISRPRMAAWLIQSHLRDAIARPFCTEPLWSKMTNTKSSSSSIISRGTMAYVSPMNCTSNHQPGLCWLQSSYPSIGEFEQWTNLRHFTGWWDVKPSEHFVWQKKERV